MVFLYLLVSGYYYFFPWNGAMFPTSSLNKRQKNLLILIKHIPSTVPPTFRLCLPLRCLKREKPKRKKEKRRINFGFGNGESREEGLGDLQRG